MEKDVIIRKAFGFPGGIERILRNGFAVHTDIDMLFLLGVAGLDAAGQPAFDPPSLIIIGPGAFSFIVAAAFVAVDEELAHIIPDPVEVFD